MNIKDELLKRKKQYTKLTEDVNKQIIGAPLGRLRINQIKGNYQFYHRVSPSDRLGTYIPANEMDLVRRLAQKDYDQKLLKYLQQEINAIDTYLKLSPATGPEDLFGTLNDKRREIVIPAFDTDEMVRKKWEGMKYERMGFAPDDPEYYTDKGERVRSKAEVIIANKLLKYDILYHYECPLFLKGFGWVRPDFMILNLRLRKVYYWEHLGMMDNEGYVNDNLIKIRWYQKNGIYLGEKLIITSETNKYPMDIREIDAIIQHFLL